MNAGVIEEKIDLACASLLALHDGKSELKYVKDEKNVKYGVAYNGFILVADLPTFFVMDYVHFSISRFLLKLNEKRSV